MNIKKYYLIGLIPMLLTTIVLTYVGIDFLNTTIFLLGFIFPYSINTPSLREKVERHHYRFSFLRFCLVIYDFAYDKLPKFKQGIASLIYPISLGVILSFMTSEVKFHFAIIGWICWMLFFKFALKEGQLLNDIESTA